MKELNYEQLLEMLDLSEPAEFEYFEDLADLLESEEKIEYQAFHKLVSGIDMKTLETLINNYFDDIMEKLPDSGTDLYLIFEQEKRALKGLARNAEEDNNMVLLTEELYKFRTWYSGVENVKLNGKPSTLINAIASARSTKMDNLDDDDYDFTNALNYEVDEYIMSFGDMIAEEEEDDEETDEGESED